MKSAEKPKYNVFQNVSWMIQVAWNAEKSVLLICALHVLLEVLLNLVQLFIAPEILSKVEMKAPVADLLATIAIFTAALFLVQGFRKYIESLASFPRIDNRTAIVAKIAYKCNTTSYPNTLDEQFIQLREKAYMSSDGNHTATEHIWITLTSLLKNVCGLVVYLLILSQLDNWLILIVAGTCIAGFLVSRYTNNWRYARRKEEEKILQKMFYLLSKAEAVELAKDVRIFGLQNWLIDMMHQAVQVYLDFRLSCERVQILSDLTEAVLTMARNGVAYAWLIHMALNKGMSVSEFLLYFAAISTLTTWMMGILQELSTLHRESLDIDRVRAFLEYPEPFVFENGKTVPQTEGYELKMENVSYRYPGATEDTIRALTLTVQAGEKLAIVGLNGAGKTTLVKLLCGLLDPTEGRVLLNGEDIRIFNRREYYALFSAVFQEFSLLDVTIAETIAQTHTGIDEEWLIKCVETAGLTDMIAKLPKGLQTHVGREVYLDGVQFSGGQLQRLMLARALYKNGAILLLDEPTAALDPIAENELYLKYSDMTNGKTALFISHRLASTRFCDRILMIGDGGILEEGTHESLLVRGGAYAQLFDIQSRYYQEGKEF